MDFGRILAQTPTRLVLHTTCKKTNKNNKCHKSGDKNNHTSNYILRLAKYDLETDCGPWGFLSGPNFSSSGETPRIGPGQFLLVSITGLSFGTTDGSLTLARVRLFLLNLQTHTWGCG